MILKVLRILTLMMSHPTLVVQRKEINHLLIFTHQRKEVPLMFLLISFEQFINATTQKLDPLEVYNEVNAIPELSPDEQWRACTWFIENEKQFIMLKTLPVERKKGMMLMFISPRA
ncbi:hypothetical protein ACE6H2_015606 [Prunus campanulata]